MDPITVIVKISSGSQYSIQVSEDATIAELKKLLVPQVQTPEEQQRLIYSGHILANEKTLKDYSIEIVINN